MTYTLLGFAAALEAASRRMEHEQAVKCEEAAVIVENEAKRVLGTYEYGWPRLSPYTLAHKTTGDSPGLETGGMRDSVQHVSNRDGFEVGSNDHKALWFELGTRTGQPPRPFLSGALQRKMPEIEKKLGEILTVAFGGGD